MRNTQEPLYAIAREKENSRREQMIESWIKMKRSELEYVSVAVGLCKVSRLHSDALADSMQGAVIFATVPTCLGWIEISKAHWTAPAFWYVSIVLAIMSVVIAAQQTSVLSSLQKTKFSIVQDRLVQSVAALPRRKMLYAWQIPLQCLSYSIVAFLVGFSSYIVSPITAANPWDGKAQASMNASDGAHTTTDNSQAAITFGAVMLFVAINLIWSSAAVYHIDK